MQKLAHSSPKTYRNIIECFVFSLEITATSNHYTLQEVNVSIIVYQLKIRFVTDLKILGAKKTITYHFLLRFSVQ